MNSFTALCSISRVLSLPRITYNKLERSYIVLGSRFISYWWQFVHRVAQSYSVFDVDLHIILPESSLRYTVRTHSSGIVSAFDRRPPTSLRILLSRGLIATIASFFGHSAYKEWAQNGEASTNNRDSRLRSCPDEPVKEAVCTKMRKIT